MNECDACHELIPDEEIGGQLGGITLCKDCIETAEPVVIA